MFGDSLPEGVVLGYALMENILFDDPPLEDVLFSDPMIKYEFLTYPLVQIVVYINILAAKYILSDLLVDDELLSYLL
jgi:hypothetical protein